MLSQREYNQKQRPWNKGRLVSQKPPLKLKEIWPTPAGCGEISLTNRPSASGRRQPFKSIGYRLDVQWLISLRHSEDAMLSRPGQQSIKVLKSPIRVRLRKPEECLFTNLTMHLLIA